MAYSVKIWAKVKADYETGDFSVAQLWKKYGIAEITIEKRVGKEKWIKGAKKEEIEKSIAEKNIELFAKHGMETETVIKEVAEGIKDEDGRVKLEFIREYNKMCGTMAPAKREVTGKGGSSLIPSDYSRKDIKETINDILNQD